MFLLVQVVLVLIVQATLIFFASIKQNLCLLLKSENLDFLQSTRQC